MLATSLTALEHVADFTKWTAELTRRPAYPRTQTRWWERAVFYEIYPRTFADSNSDGIGDLIGITRNLPYLVELGVDAIWLCPFYPSSFADGGYDVSDFTQVAPVFGSLEDFDRLVQTAHRRGLRVIIDLVANHTSSRHPWFIDASSRLDSPYRGWYFWTDQPNDWQAALNAGTAWALDPTTDQFYLHFFLASQPDLNWRNPKVLEAMREVIRFWLRRGVDGFRVDAAQCLGKRADLSSRPELRGTPIAAVNDEPYTHVVLRGMRSVVEEFGSDKLLLGEIFVEEVDRVLTYFGSDDELHLAFDFSLLRAPWSAEEVRAVVREVESKYSAVRAWPTWVIGNHDRPRVRSRYGTDERARAMAVLHLTLRGTCFIYQGEELGLENSIVPRELRIDPNGRDGYRNPIPWTSAPDSGWSGRLPRVPLPPNAVELNVTAQRADKCSMFSLYQSLLALRRAEPALFAGTLELLESDPSVVAFARRIGSMELRTYVNFGSDPVMINDLRSEHILLASDGSRIEREGRLAPCTAVVTKRS